MKIEGILIKEPVVLSFLSWNMKGLEIVLDTYPETVFLCSPKDFANDGLPPLEKRLTKGDTILLEIFADDYHRRVLRSQTFTESMVYGPISVLGIFVSPDKYENINKAERNHPNFFSVFLLYTIACAFLILSGYVNLQKKLTERDENA
jgi:hypothetical protein